MTGPGYDSFGANRGACPSTRAEDGCIEPLYMFTGERPDPAKNPRAEFARMLTSDPQFARDGGESALVRRCSASALSIRRSIWIWRASIRRIRHRRRGHCSRRHPELLEALAQLFREHNYSLRSVITLIAKSSTYQLSSRFPGEWKASYAKYFARKFVRRLKAEEIHDSLVHATDLYTDIPFAEPI